MLNSSSPKPFDFNKHDIKFSFLLKVFKAFWILICEENTKK